MSFFTWLDSVTVCAECLKWSIPEVSTSADWINVVANRSKSIANNAQRIKGDKSVAQIAPPTSIISFLFVRTSFMCWSWYVIDIFSRLLWYVCHCFSYINLLPYDVASRHLTRRESYLLSPGLWTLRCSLLSPWALHLCNSWLNIFDVLHHYIVIDRLIICYLLAPISARCSVHPKHIRAHFHSVATVLSQLIHHDTTYKRLLPGYTLRVIDFI